MSSASVNTGYITDRYPFLQIPVTGDFNRIITLPDIVMYNKTSINSCGLPYLPVPCVMAREIKRIMGYHDPKSGDFEMKFLCYNILSCVANAHNNLDHDDLMRALRSAYRTIEQSIKTNSLSQLYSAISRDNALNWLKIFEWSETSNWSLDDITTVDDVNKIIEKYGLTGAANRDNALEDPKTSLIVYSELFPHSTEGGLSGQQILTIPYFYLSHANDLIETLEPILNSGFLLPNYEDREDQYPGVYFSVYNDKGLSDLDLSYYLIFSLSLFHKRAWHIQENDPYGAITAQTWDYYTFPIHLMAHDADYDNLVAVFHDKVPLDYLEIIVAKDSMVDEVTRIVDGRFPVVSLSEFNKYPDYKRTKLLDEYGPYSNNPPNFCVNNNRTEYTGMILPDSNIRATLINCGLDVSLVDELIETKTYSELLSIVDDNCKSVYRTGEPVEPIIHPPY